MVESKPHLQFFGPNLEDPEKLPNKAFRFHPIPPRLVRCWRRLGIPRQLVWHRVLLVSNPSIRISGTFLFFSCPRILFSRHLHKTKFTLYSAMHTRAWGRRSSVHVARGTFSRWLDACLLAAYVVPVNWPSIHLWTCPSVPQLLLKCCLSFDGYLHASYTEQGPFAPIAFLYNSNSHGINDRIQHLYQYLGLLIWNVLPAEHLHQVFPLMSFMDYNQTHMKLTMFV